MNPGAFAGSAMPAYDGTAFPSFLSSCGHIACGFATFGRGGAAERGRIFFHRAGCQKRMSRAAAHEVD